MPPPASVAIGTKKKLLALTSNVAPLPTVTLLELETSPKPDSASVPSLMVVAPVYAFAMTYAILRVIGWLMPLRVTEKQEALGMDVVQHGEEAYATGEGAILVAP